MIERMKTLADPLTDAEVGEILGYARMAVRLGKHGTINPEEVVQLCEEALRARAALAYLHQVTYLEWRGVLELQSILKGVPTHG